MGPKWAQMGPKQQGPQMGPKWAPNMGPTFFLFPQNPSQPTLQWKLPHLLAINSKLTCPMTSTSLRTCWVNWINSNHCNFENSILPRVFRHVFLQCYLPTIQCWYIAKPHVPYFSALSMFLAISRIFPGPNVERSRRVSMTAWTFRPDDNNFCQFMTPNLLKSIF